MESKWQVTTKILEEGSIYFFYKPKKGVTEVKNIMDIQRFYMVMDPYTSSTEDKRLRFIVMGPKKLPAVNDGKEQAWGFVEKVGGRGFKVSAAQSPSTAKRTARAAGEGIYSIVKHNDHTHMAYSLELPARLGEVQKSLNIERQGNYILIIRHPYSRISERIKGRNTKGIEKNDGFLQQFGERKYIPADPPTLLNYEGSPLYIIGVNDEVASLGLEFNKDRETADTADIFRELQLSKERHATEPMIKGKWK
jgi:hypothetical protein